MVGFLIATHGGLAEGLLNSIQLITGKQEKLRLISIDWETDVERFGQEIIEQVISLDDGNGVIIFTDIKMATPYNRAVMASQTLKPNHLYKVISGVNLPMLLEAISIRMQKQNLEEICQAALRAGTEGISEFFQEFEEPGIAQTKE